VQEYLRNFLLGPLHALTPIPYLLFGFPPCDSVGFLDLHCELLAFAGCPTQASFAWVGVLSVFLVSAGEKRSHSRRRRPGPVSQPERARPASPAAVAWW